MSCFVFFDLWSAFCLTWSPLVYRLYNDSGYYRKITTIIVNINNYNTKKDNNKTRKHDNDNNTTNSSHNHNETNNNKLWLYILGLAVWEIILDIPHLCKVTGNSSGLGRQIVASRCQQWGSERLSARLVWDGFSFWHFILQNLCLSLSVQLFWGCVCFKWGAKHRQLPGHGRVCCEGVIIRISHNGFVSNTLLAVCFLARLVVALLAWLVSATRKLCCVCFASLSSGTWVPGLKNGPLIEAGGIELSNSKLWLGSHWVKNARMQMRLRQPCPWFPTATDLCSDEQLPVYVVTGLLCLAD